MQKYFSTLGRMTAFMAMMALIVSLGMPSADAKASPKSTKTASNTSATSSAATSQDIQVVGVDPNSEVVSSIQKTVQSLVDASNSHNLEEVLKHYSTRFTSGDNLLLNDVKKLVLETWQTFPDIQYKSRVMEIRVSGDWATVESVDTSTATAKVDPVVSDKAGILNSRSRGLLYLHHTRDGWEIMSDYTLFEIATISYGNVEPLDYTLSAPEQIFSGENYSARLNLAIPRGLLAIASISQEPLVYPQIKPKDRFRSMSADKSSLERIFQANTTNNNEIVTATVGLTQIGQDDEDRPTIKLGGLVTVVKRVNIIPKNTFKTTSGKDNLIKTSADGKVDLSKAGDVVESAPDSTPEGAIPQGGEQDASPSNGQPQNENAPNADPNQ